MDVAGLIEPGDRVAWAPAALEPVELLAALEAGLHRVPQSTALLNISVTNAIDPVLLAERMHVVALGGAVTNRRFQKLGALDVIPVNYSALPGLVADGTLGIDVVLTHVAPDKGNYNASLMVDHLSDAIPKARVVVALVNDQLPIVFGDVAVASEHVTHVLPVSRPPLELASRAASDVDKAIGENVARLIRDGDTLQVGLGAMPDAVLESVTRRRHLGIHSGTIGDGVAELMKSGVITNARKTVDPGLCVTAGLLGSSNLYRWAHRNEALRVRSPRYTHDNQVHQSLDNLVGINTALEVDLTGQMNAEVVGGKHIGMIGGHSDFMQGCLRSNGGRGIIAMHSATSDRSASRIVSSLSCGVVTTARHHADYVVTEYGIAALRGRSVSERANALIAIAHPDFRVPLTAIAEKGLI
jgi:acyl-CoA hydrolase